MAPVVTNVGKWSDFESQVALGNVPEITNYPFAGEAPNLTTGSLSTLWTQQGIYSYLTANTELFLSSSNAGDNQPYLIRGMTADYLEKTAVGVVAGQTQTSVGEFFRVFDVISLGFTNNAGDIYLAEADTLTGGVPNTPSKIKAKIEIGRNTTSQAIRTIPAGMTGLIYLVTFSVERGADVEFSLLFRNQPGGVLLDTFKVNVYQTVASLSLQYPFAVQERTDFEIRALSDTNNVRASVAISAVLVTNDP